MIFETVRELLAHQLEVSPESITPETDIFEDLGADSLDVVELVMSIEEEYDIVITDERAGNVRTVAQVVEMLNDLMFSYHWCVDRLPETCRNFVTNVARDFPLIIDVQVGVRRACDLRACVARRAWAPSCPTARRWRPSTRE